MKKIIFSFSLFFAVLFINSCRYEEVVAPNENSFRLSSYDVTYNNSLPDIFKFIYKNDKIDSIYNYVSSKDTMIIKFKYIGNKISEVINYNVKTNKYYYRKYEYTFDLLTKFTYSDDNRIIHTNIYNYENSKLKKMFINIMGDDSIVVTSFVENRPEIIKYFRKKNNIMDFYREEKIVYKNGNRVEVYYRQDTTKELALFIKYSYDLSKPSVEKLCPAFMFSQSDFFELSNNYNSNIISDQTYFDYECNGVKSENLVEVSKRTHQNTFNKQNYISSFNVSQSSNCTDNILNIKANFTWE